ncbi:EthD family reductase [Acidisoma cellulosilytica]|uniref:EthD family reductase n=1 Tax=Acidisoma cellulosilyticum TaxID=2802395 RepID=A0A963Z6Q7_9PROT|nr:EthD family reductase [Acidisoma cellulosilyticum]MCB8883100.1 EthD family reductase [Acidisoma cellulosilyticum]
MFESIEKHSASRRGFSARAIGLATTAAALGMGVSVQRSFADTASTPGMIKIISILARKDGESREDFIHHWETVHAPLVYAVPGVLRYTLSIVTSSSTRTDGVKPIDVQIDGLAELWFKDRASLENAASSDAIKKVLADGTLFVGSEVDLVAEERIIIPRG